MCQRTQELQRTRFCVVAGSGIECGTNCFGQRGKLVRFTQDRQAMAAGQCLGVSAGQKYGNTWVPFGDRLRQSHTIKISGQHDVGEYQVDRRACSKNIQSSLGIVYGDRAVVKLFRHRDRFDVRVVLDDQNDFTAAVRLARRLAWSEYGNRRMAAGQI